MARVLTVAASLVLLVSCDGFKAVGLDSRAGDGGTGQQDAPPGGPGGVLPTGYCCQEDEDCRFRTCRDFGGGKMCVDYCTHDGACQGHLPGFHCVDADAGQGYRRCRPDSPTLACKPASSFVRGTRARGDCCTATHTGTAGLECAGGFCVGWGPVSNPYMCTNLCATDADCAGPYRCQAAGDLKQCAPLNMQSYTCRQ